MADDGVIRAAGVILLRDNDGTDEFLLVHRPHRVDWSLPKGKLEAGEHPVAAAVRECNEETGYTPTLGAPLPPHSYEVLGQPKVVNYWRAWIHADEGFTPDDEIDEIAWLPVAAAASRMTYPDDVELVDRAAALPRTSPLVILRHTQAMKRNDFKDGPDADRPLTGKGRSQSKALIPLLEAFGVERVHSSSALRCTESVRRLAKTIETTVIAEPNLTEERHTKNPARAADRARKIARITKPVVMCSHRPVLPSILDAVGDELGIDAEAYPDVWQPKLPTGGFLVVHREFAEDGSIRVVAIERHTLTEE